MTPRNRLTAQVEKARQEVSSSDDEEGQDSAEENKSLSEDSDMESEEDERTRPPPKKQLFPDDKQVVSQSKGIRQIPLEVEPKASKQVKYPPKPTKMPKSKPAMADVLSSGSSSKKPTDSPAPHEEKVSKRAKKKAHEKKQLASLKQVVFQTDTESDSQSNGILQLPLEVKTLAHAGKTREEGQDSAEENEDLAEDSDTESEGDMKTPPPPKKQLPFEKQVVSQSEGSKGIRELSLEVEPIASKQMKSPPKQAKMLRSKPAMDDALSSGASSKKPTDSPAPLHEKVSKRAKKKEHASVKPAMDDALSSGASSKKPTDSPAHRDERVSKRAKKEHASVKPAMDDVLSSGASSKNPTDSPAHRDERVSKRAKKKEQSSVKPAMDDIFSFGASSTKPTDSPAPRDERVSKRAKKKEQASVKPLVSQSVTESDSQSKGIRQLPLDVKTIASNPLKSLSKAKKIPRSKPSTIDVLPSEASSKRPADSPPPGEGKDSKKKKEHDSNEDVEEKLLKKNGESTLKKPLFQRLWSEEDIYTILNGLVEYSENKGVDPASANMNAFYDYIRKSLHIDASKSQMQEKIRRLKKKYQTNLMNGRNGVDKTFSKAHDQRVYELSTEIWGTEYRKGKGKNAEVKGNLGLANMEEVEKRDGIVGASTGGGLKMILLIAENEDIHERKNKLILDDVQHVLQQLNLRRNWTALEIGKS